MFDDGALLPMLVEGTRLNAAFLSRWWRSLAGYVFMQQELPRLPDAGRGRSRSRRPLCRLLGEADDLDRMLAGGAMAGIAGMGEVSRDRWAS